MENDQQASLASNSMSYHSKYYQQLQLKLSHESKIKNICILVIVAIIASNYLQVRSLRSNYIDLQALIEEVVKTVRENKLNIEKQAKHRAGNLSELQSTFGKKTQELKGKAQLIEKSLKEETTRLGTRISKYQQSLNRLRNDLDKQQTFPMPSSQAKDGAMPKLQTIRRQNTITTFLLDQIKEEYHQSKSKWLKSMLHHETFADEKAKTAFLTSLSNIKLPHENVLTQSQNKQLQQKIRKRLSNDYKLDQHQTELPFCIVVPTYNNAKNFRYEYNLQSILNLNYKNYKVVIIDDASTDGTYELISDLISRLNSDIPIHLIRNEMKMTAVPNINKAIRQFCFEGDIAVLVDGDDELLVKDSLKVFNSVYQSQKVDVVYSNHLKLYWHQDDVFKGWSSAYTAAEIKGNAYRDVPQKISHLRSFKVSLFLRIKQDDLKDQFGSWLKSTYDEVICLPILEMSCGRIAFVEEYFYLYNFGIGTNDLMVDGKKQKEIADYVKHSKKKYSCLDEK